jgi:Domain of unknown function (DUF1707)/Cell wall-active antibiotics response 4TMS YvqF
MADNSRMDPHGFNEISRLRASDADRDSAASVINQAMAEGRLTAEEHSDRLEAIYSAKTHADLAPLLDDLPGRSVAVPPATSAAARAPVRRGGRIVAVFAGASRKGSWHAEPVMDVVTVFGGADMDFRDAVLPGKEVTIKAVCVMGGLDVIVPPEMRVINSTVAILGGVDVSGDSAESLQPDAPVLHITGTCVMGGINVERKIRKQDNRKGWGRAIGP